MKPGAGKSKGGSFEREICQKLSKWVSYGERDDIFWRSAMSGGRATVGMKKGIKRTSQAGDITAIDPLGNKLTDKFVIECKFYKNIHIESMMFGKPKVGTILEFWTKLYKDSVKLNKDMMLVIKQNGWPVLLGVRWDSYFRKVLDTYYDISPLATFLDITPECYLYDFNRVLKEVDPEGL